jgi:hypothetical protein
MLHVVPSPHGCAQILNWATWKRWPWPIGSHSQDVIRTAEVASFWWMAETKLASGVQRKLRMTGRLDATLRAAADWHLFPLRSSVWHMRIPLYSESRTLVALKIFTEKPVQLRPIFPENPVDYCTRTAPFVHYHKQRNLTWILAIHCPKVPILVQVNQFT